MTDKTVIYRMLYASQMVLNDYREEADSVLKPLAKKMRHINPDTLSWIAFLGAVLGGISFFIGVSSTYVLLGSLFIFLNAFFDAMDGRVAELAGKTSLRGDFLDHALDRYADIFIIGGIAFGPLSRLSLGFLAILGILMTSYMGTQAQAVGVKRNYGGVAGRADRLILLILVPIFYVLLAAFGYDLITIAGYNFTLFELLMIWFAVAGHLTALHRWVASWRALSD